MAKRNQETQQQRKRNKAREPATKKQQPRKQAEKDQVQPRRSRKHVMPQKNTQNRNRDRKEIQNPNETFRTESREAALQQSTLHMEKQQNRSFIKINEDEIVKSPTIECITLSDSTQNSPIKVYTSSNQYDFMITSPDSPELPTNYTSKISTPKIDKVVEKIHKIKSSPALSSSPILNAAIPSGTKEETAKQSG